MANWPAMRPTFTTGTPERVGEHDRHLQDDRSFSRMLSAENVVERLGAVAGLEQERSPGGDLGRATSVQDAGLAGEHQRRDRRRSASGRGRASASSGQSGCWSAGHVLPRRRGPRLAHACHGRDASAHGRHGADRAHERPGADARADAGGVGAGRAAVEASRDALRRSGGEDARGVVAEAGDGPLDEAAGGLGGDAEAPRRPRGSSCARRR